MKYIKYLIVVLLLIIGITVISSSIEENSTSRGVYYDNFEYTDNVKFNGIDGFQLDYTAELNQIGDFYEISFDVINDSSYDVEIADYFYHEDDSHVKYQLSYEDGESIKNGDILHSGKSRKILYRVSYYNGISSDDYSFDTNFYINYQQTL